MDQETTPETPTEPQNTVQSTEDHGLSIGLVAELTGLSYQTIRNRCDSGQLRYFTTKGGHRRFTAEAVADAFPYAFLNTPVAMAWRKGALMDIAEAARTCGIRRSQLRRWTDAGLISSYALINGKRMYHIDGLDAEVDALVESDMRAGVTVERVRKPGEIIKGDSPDQIIRAAITTLREKHKDRLPGRLSRNAYIRQALLNAPPIDVTPPGTTPQPAEIVDPV